MSDFKGIETVVGTTWESVRGTRRVETAGFVPPLGEIRLSIITAGERFPILLRPDELPNEIRRDEKTLQFHLGQIRAVEASKAAETSAVDTFQDYANAVSSSPMQAARVVKTLGRATAYKGRMYRLGDLIQLKVSEGSDVVVSPQGECRLQDPKTGIFLDEKATTKTGMAFATWLVRQSQK